jgi:competence protein ComEA
VERQTSHYWMLSVLVLLSLILVICALWQPKSKYAGEWMPVNRELKATLAALEAPAEEKESIGKSGKDRKDEGEGAAVKKDFAKADGDQINEAGNRLIEADNSAEGEAKKAGGGTEEKKEAVRGIETKEAMKGIEEKEAVRGTEAAKLPSVSALGAEDAGKIDINRATIEELDTLPGIGAAKAKAIVGDREQNGPFGSVDDLERVKGIGPKMVEQMKDKIVASHASVR